MSKPLFFVDWTNPKEKPKQTHQVPVVHVYEDSSLLILHKKQLVKISSDTAIFARWE